ncbi:enoyl-CoA hydratase/isomerase family protein [Pseudomonas gingeri]|uniref:3-hydroxyacyl-CoA dehydrogenase NAD-binding domain-containing protein n=1 Tax=Pseudomonas gingeri TaxID=117681 RepID=UPI0015A24C6A|nr:3-hydroxyacyl-CoA dehydrogenase NAD-binding domain-containing protein [Pseudomonas gingeri]NWD66901.1 enoyl-CoA hydratase/isomerase family protein [Pseudomonas gingeri]
MIERRVQCDVYDGVAVLTIDNPPVNAGSVAVRRQLLDAVQTYSARTDISALVLIGAGNTFIAGSDLKEFGLPLESPQLPELIAAIESSSKPVVAALHGAALGGGFELALGCDARVAMPDCVVGLPEVTLGMIPGAGGTQRLPRLVGVVTAIEMICQGTRLPASEAFELGAIDALATGDLLVNAIAFAKQVQKRRVAELAVPIAVSDSIDVAKRQAVSKGRNRPAVNEAIESILNAQWLPVADALQHERAVFQRLRESREAAALRYQFFAERSAGKLPSLEGVTVRPVESVGVIGAGTMGSAIAAAFLDAGMQVTLVEQSAAKLSAGFMLLTDLYQRQVASGRLDPQVRDSLLANLNPSLRYEDLASCQLIIEAVFEDQQVKLDVMSKIASVAGPDAVVATNTSYLDVDVIAASYPFPENVCGLHFFSPANVMKLLEIVDAERTSATTLATALAVAKRLKKVPVIASNAFGFIGNRIYSAYRRQAEFMLEEGASPYEIDQAMENFGFAMGPFAVADLSGLDIAWRMRKAQAPHRNPDARYVAIPDFLCDIGNLGRKTGAGYYRYPDGKREPDPAVLELIIDYRADRQITTKTFTAEQIQRRLLLAMVNESALVLAEGVARNQFDIDLALVNGYGFARWQGGPVFWAKGQDAAQLRDELAALGAVSGPGVALGDLSVLGI